MVIKRENIWTNEKLLKKIDALRSTGKNFNISEYTDVIDGSYYTYYCVTWFED